MTATHKGPTETKSVAFLFDDAESRVSVLGNKGAGLVELVALGMRVPYGFTIGTAVARSFTQTGCVPKRLDRHLRHKISALEAAAGRRFGVPGEDGTALMVSVRSTAAVSMPGMMDTVLNVGMNWEIVEAMAAQGDDSRAFAYSSYLRFIRMFGEVVLGVPKEQFEEHVEVPLSDADCGDSSTLAAQQLKASCQRSRQICEEHCGAAFPDAPWVQLTMAVEAVLRSWNNPRAVEYRRSKQIAGDLGTAVTVQTMVFGNRDQCSCSGVVFSRDVVRGQRGIWGEFVVGAQGEGLVAGTVTPSPLSGMAQWNEALYQELRSLVEVLEAKRNRPVEVEFTVESGVLYILQVRNAVLTPLAAVCIAVHFCEEGRLSEAEALSRVTPQEVVAVRQQGFEAAELSEAMKTRLLYQGIGAAPGAVVGTVVFEAEDAVQAAALGQSVVLVRRETSPSDLPGMLAAKAIVTMYGGATCHAAVVARELGKPAVVGCSATLLFVEKGDIVAVNGASGAVLSGAIQLAAATMTKEVEAFFRWRAAAEAAKWRTPRLVFEYFAEQKNAEEMLADFYLSDAMATAAQGTALEEQANDLRRQVHMEVAERIAVYLVVAIGGEMRHLPDSSGWCPEAVAELLGTYKVTRNHSREFRSLAQAATNVQLASMDVHGQIRFLELCTKVFRMGNWSRGFGGARWANIAEAAYKFMTGSLSHSLFVDHAFDLHHNTGHVFGKNKMIVVSSLRLYAFLVAKKMARSVASLQNRFVRLLSSEQSTRLVVNSLYRQGLDLLLWSEVDVEQQRAQENDFYTSHLIGEKESVTPKGFGGPSGNFSQGGVVYGDSTADLKKAIELFKGTASGQKLIDDSGSMTPMNEVEFFKESDDAAPWKSFWEGSKNKYIKAPTDQSLVSMAEHEVLLHEAAHDEFAVSSLWNKYTFHASDELPAEHYHEPIHMAQATGNAVVVADHCV